MSAAWDLATPILAATGLASFALAAWLSWRAGHRWTPFLLLLPMALLGLSIQQSHLPGLVWRPESQILQAIGVATLLLALMALFLVQTHEHHLVNDLPREGRSLVRDALLLGALAAAIAVMVGVLAFFQSQDMQMQHISTQAVSMARSLETSLVDTSNRQDLLNRIRDHWRKSNRPYAEASFFIVGPDGRVEACSNTLRLTGHDLSDWPLKTDLPRVDTIGSLLTRESEWVGRFHSPSGEEAVASFNFNPTLKGLVVVQIPMRAARSELLEALRPWLVGFAVTLVLLPLAMVLLIRAFMGAISALRQAEDARRQAEGHLRSVVRNLPVMLGVLEEDRRYSLHEGKALETLGIQPEQATGRTPAELFGEDADRDHDLERVFQGSAFSTIRKVHDRIFQVWYEPLRLPSGSVERIMALGIDITDRLQTERDQVASLIKFQSLFENSLDGLFLFDDQSRIVDLNPAASELLGVSRDEALGRMLREVGQSTGGNGAGLFQTLLAEGVAEGEMTFRRRDGSTRTLEFRARANILPGLHFSITRDITERRILEERFERARRLESLGVLAGGLAHDFNNLLMTIMGSAEIALEKSDPENPTGLELERIAAAVRQASELTQQMLTCSGQNPRQTRLVRLDELVAETVHLMEPVFPPQITILQQHAPEQPCIQADPIQLRQVVLNLVTNALEAIGEAVGQIHLSTGPCRLTPETVQGFEFAEGLTDVPGVLLTVRDSGKGMSEELRQRIFDPFFSTKFAGRGLGLASTLGVVRGHGGAVRVDSARGQGTSFQVLFPAAREPQEPEEPTPAGPAPSTGPGQPPRPCILVADDEESLLGLLQEALGRRGFQVLTATDGRRALEIFHSTPDLQAVVLDVKMPGLSGLEACRAMHSLRPEVPILLSTGFSEVETDQEAQDYGAFAVLRKPFRVGALTEKLSAALGRKV